MATFLSQDAQNRKRKRPPDNPFAYSAALEVPEKQSLADNILDTAVWLSGNELKLRVIQFYSGSRTSKKSARR